MKHYLSMMLYVCAMVISSQTVDAKDRMVANKYVTVSTSHDRICKLEAIGNNFYAYYLPVDGTIPTGETIPFSVSPTADYTLTSEPNPSIAVKNSATWSVSSTVPEKKGASGKIFVKEVVISITYYTETPGESEDPGDGEDSVSFTCNVSPSFFSPSYEWLASEEEGSWPVGVGNSPGLNYSLPKSKSTVVRRCKWYAKPNSEWMDDTPFQAPYSVNCKVTIDDVIAKTKSVNNLIVCLPNKLGEVIGASLAGSKTIKTSTRDVNNATEWYVLEKDGFCRTDPHKTIYLLGTSYFYKKIDVHEQKHVTQYTDETPWKNLYLAQQYYSNYIWPLKSTISEADLQKKIADTIEFLWKEDKKVDLANLLQSEKNAYTVSNAEGLKFLNVKMEDVSKHISLLAGTSFE
jgi:hypothetical protein